MKLVANISILMGFSCLQTFHSNLIVCVKIINLAVTFVHFIVDFSDGEKLVDSIFLGEAWSQMYKTPKQTGHCLSLSCILACNLTDCINNKYTILKKKSHIIFQLKIQCKTVKYILYLRKNLSYFMDRMSAYSQVNSFGKFYKERVGYITNGRSKIMNVAK